MAAAEDSAPVLAARIAELETRIAFQEHSINELSDALAETRLESARTAQALRRVLDDLRQLRASLPADDPGSEPPPPHY